MTDFIFSGILCIVALVATKCELYPTTFFVYRHFLRRGKDLTTFGEYAIITGATDGLGKEMARIIAKKMKVILIARNPEKLEEVKKEIGAHETVVIDFSTNFDSTPLINAIKDKEIGLLINNVGGTIGKLPDYFTCLSEKELVEISRVNCDSMVRMTRIVLPQMLERKKGNIVNIGSISGVPNYSGGLLTQYAASKAFMLHFTHNLAAEIRGSGVHIEVHNPGIFCTKLSRCRRPNLFAPSVETQATRCVQCIGYEHQVSPYWMHDIQCWIVTFPFVDRILTAVTLPTIAIRKR